tara:strand:- start:1704 stop:3521 length:1818 start_codon:yes stop_codon:yes gene_type:complete
MAFFIPALMGAARFGGMALSRSRGVAKSGLRASSSMGKGAIGFGAGAAMAGGGSGQTAVPSSNEQSMDNVIPFPAAAGGGRRGGGGSGGVSSAQATSALQDGDSSNATVNALNDIREVLVDIKGDTATIATGLTVPKAESPDENKLNAMFGGKGGGKGVPKGSAGLASAAGGIAALTSIFGKGLFGGDSKTDEEKLKEVSEKLEDGVDNFTTKLTQSLVTQGNKLIASKTLVGGTVDAAKTGLKTVGSMVKDKLTGTKTPSIDKAGAPTIDSSKVVGTAPDGSKVVQAQSGNFTKAGADGRPTTQIVKPQDIQGAKVKIDGAGKQTTKGLAKVKDLASSFLKNIGKYGIKQMPLVGAAAGLGMAAWRLMKGDKAGAAAELAGVALVGPVGGVTIDAGLLARDMYNDAYGDPESDDMAKRFPHDTDAATEGSGYGEKFGAIKDYVTGKLKEMKENFGKSDIEKPTSARPEISATGGRQKRSQKKAQDQWDEKFGETHNKDGSLKATAPEMQITETTGADLIGAPTPAETEGGSVTIDAASNQVADAQASASEEKAMQVAALQSGPLADLGSVVSGLGGKVEYLPVLVSDKSVVDTEINSLMVQKNN